MNIVAAIALPFIAGTIGWFTNYLAVKMLFHPRKPINILGFSFQGIFPKRQSYIAEKIGQLVARDLLNTNDIFSNIASEKNLAKIKISLGKKIEQYFDLTFVQKYPMAARLLPFKTKQRIQEEILDEVEKMIPSLLQGQIRELQGNLQIDELITEKVNQLSSERLEKLLWNILAEEFKFIEWIGAFLGFTIGLIQVIIVYFVL